MSCVISGRGKMPGPTCQWTKPQMIVDGTTNRQSSFATGRLTGADEQVCRAASPLKIKSLIFEGEQLLRFFRSVAYAYETGQRIKTNWVPYKESKVLNIIYGLFPFKGEPGTVEVIIENENMLGIEIQKRADIFLFTFLDRLSDDPGKAGKYLQQLTELRETSLRNIQRAYSEALNISRELVTQAENSIQVLAGLKATATIMAKTLGLMTGATLPFVTNVSYDVALSYIEELDESSDATLAGIAANKKILEELSKRKAEELSEKKADALIGKAAGYANEMSKLQAKVDELEKQLERNLKQAMRSKFTTRLKSRQELLTATRKEMQWAERKATGFAAINYLFFAQDIYDAIEVYKKDSSK